MARLVDLTKPYNLNENQIKWVKETIKEMSAEEKNRQLFFNLFLFFEGENHFTENPFTNEEIIEKFHIGGARYQGGTSEKVQDLLNSLQNTQKYLY